MMGRFRIRCVECLEDTDVRTDCETTATSLAMCERCHRDYIERLEANIRRANIRMLERLEREEARDG